MTSSQGAMFEDYPYKPKRTKPKPECCDRWEAFVADRAERKLGVHLVWRVVHRYAHSRLPFSLATLATAAHTTEANAGRVVEGAVDAEWIARVQPEWDGQLPAPVWFGRLERRGK
jgi:hypothetical protein